MTLAAAAGAPNLKEDLLKGYKMSGTSYKAHLDGYNNLDYWMGKTEKSARREIFYYDETDLMAIRVDAWKMHIGVKKDGSWFNAKSYPSVPYIFNLLMEAMKKTGNAERQQQLKCRSGGRCACAWPPLRLLIGPLRTVSSPPDRRGPQTASMSGAAPGCHRADKTVRWERNDAA